MKLRRTGPVPRLAHHRRSDPPRPLATVALAAVLLCGCYDARSGAERIEQERRTPKVLLIGIDGVRPDVLSAVSTPNLDALAAAGFRIDDARTTTPSVSGPAWSSMLIGVWPNKHGVTDNEYGGKRFGDFPDFLTRIEELRPELTTVAIADWLPLVQADDGRPNISDAIDVKHVLDGYALGWPEADARSAELAVEVLRSEDPDAMFVYLGNPDETSHEHASIGAEYRTAIALADRHVGQIIDALRARASYTQEDWLILVSTDHGRRADGGHGGNSDEEMTTFVIGSGPAAEGAILPSQAFVVDLVPTALAHLGIAVPAEWELDGGTLIHR